MPEDATLHLGVPSTSQKPIGRDSKFQSCQRYSCPSVLGGIKLGLFLSGVVLYVGLRNLVVLDRTNDVKPL